MIKAAGCKPKLSILYLRCLSRAVVHSAEQQAPFNSLFEMQLMQMYALSSTASGGAFNSLFEMQNPCFWGG